MNKDKNSNEFDIIELIDLDHSKEFEELMGNLKDKDKNEDSEVNDLLFNIDDNEDFENRNEAKNSFRLPIINKLNARDDPVGSRYLDKHREEGLYIDAYKPKYTYKESNKAPGVKNTRPQSQDVKAKHTETLHVLHNNEENKKKNVHPHKHYEVDDVVRGQILYNEKFIKNNVSKKHQKKIKRHDPFPYEHIRNKRRLRMEKRFKFKFAYGQAKPYSDIVLAIMIGMVLSRIIILLFHPVIIDGPSMQPTYYGGNWVRCDNDFTESDIQRGDVIVFTKSRKTYIKRVVGIPGDILEVKDGKLYVNGINDKSLQFDPIEDAGILSDDFIYLEDHEFFCMGDNRNQSIDCRNIGPISFYNIDYIVIEKIFDGGLK